MTVPIQICRIIPTILITSIDATRAFGVYGSCFLTGVFWR